jgi:XTP/dITP diphosphohydrolase
VTPLQRAVEVMDRLRSPGGCPWDAAQTHESLTRYLVEETYEVLEAIETGDALLLREELGDLLLQVLFHARIAQESAADAFGIDDVAQDLVDKLIRRHPHVFAAAPTATAADLDEVWEQQKAQEKGRRSAVDGVPANQPALALAGKLVSRANRAGVAPAATATTVAPATSDTKDAHDDIADRLLAVVADAVRLGVDPETALRRRARRYRADVLAIEAARDATH